MLLWAVALTAVFNVAPAADVGPRSVSAAASCTTDGQGRCTVNHYLGVKPDAVLVAPNTPGTNQAFMLNTVRDSYTATTFQVRAMYDRTTPKSNGTIWFTYVASVGMGGTPPAPSPTTSTTAPATTTSTTAPPTTTTAPPTTSVTPTSSTTTAPTTTPPAGTCPGGAAPVVFRDQDGGDMVGVDGKTYFVHNNAWNWQGSGSTQRDTIYACNASNWWLDSYGFAPDNGAVFTYPNVHLDVNNMNGKPLSTWPTALAGRFAGKGFTCGTPAVNCGSWNVAWDLWLNGVADSTSFELMVWTERSGNADPAGTQRAPYTAPDGQVYDVWWDGTHDNQAYLAFISQKTQLAGTVNLRAFIVEAQQRGYLPAGDTTVNQIDYGIEVRDTAGTPPATAAAPYRFTLTDFALDMR